MSKYRKNRNRYKYDDAFTDDNYGDEFETDDIEADEEIEINEDSSDESGAECSDEGAEDLSDEGYVVTVPGFDGGDDICFVVEGGSADEEDAENADGEAAAEEDDEPEQEAPDDPEQQEEASDEAYPEDDGDDPERHEDSPEDREDYPEDSETYPEDDEEDYEDEVEVRRRARRKRRIRNQILAYLLLAVFLVSIGVCSFLLVKKVVSKVHGKQEQQKIDEQIEALSESEEEIVIEPPKVVEEEEVVEEVDYLAEIVEACISEMPIEDKIAQLFIVTPESVTGANKVTQAGEKTKEALEKYAVGGFIYFGDNIVDREQLTNMISTTDGYRKYRMFFAVDEEGGTCSRISSSKIEVPDVGPMGDIGASGDPAKALEAGATIGTYLKEIGFNVDFAPVADIVTVTDGSAIGDRSFGSDPQAVGQMVANCVQGIQNTGVSACLKHFPGLGDTTEDTHKGRAVISKTLDELQNSNFESFRAGIEAGADFIMVGHATAEAADDSTLPCSMSKNMITGQLRDYLGYEGIVITDALNMSAVTDYYTTDEICLKAFKAGADILLMPDNFEEAYNALLDAVNNGSLSEERVNESLRRIFRVKFKNEISQ